MHYSISNTKLSVEPDSFMKLTFYFDLYTDVLYDFPRSMPSYAIKPRHNMAAANKGYNIVNI